MKILIFSNGSMKGYTHIGDYIEGYNYIICADGGIRHCDEIGIVPNLIVGDLDSAPALLLEKYKAMGAEVERFPTEKDDTDTQIAVDKAIAMGASEVVLIGGLGDRWDHSYANVMLLYRAARRGVKGWILDDKNKITISDSKLKLQGDRGQILSLFPFGGDTHIDSTVGLKYPIINKTLYMNYPLGVSNIFLERQVEISITKGWLLAILAED